MTCSKCLRMHVQYESRCLSPEPSQVCFPHCLTPVWGMFRVQTQWPRSGCTEQLDDRLERPMTQAAGPCGPAGFGQPCVLCVSVWARLCVCKCQQLLFSHQFPPLPQTHLNRNMKSGLELASGTLIPFSLFALVSTPLQAEKHLSSKSLQTTTVLNLIKEIADNRRAIKQQSFQRSTGAYIPLAQRVTALSFTSQRFFKAISPLCVPPPPPLLVHQVMLVAWNASFSWNVFYYRLWIRAALAGCKWVSMLKRSTGLLSGSSVG